MSDPKVQRVSLFQKIARPVVLLTGIGVVGGGVYYQNRENEILREQGNQILATVNEKNSALDTKVTEQERTILALKQELSQSEAGFQNEISGLSQVLEDERAERGDLEDRLVQAESDNLDLRDKLQEQENRDGELSSSISDLTKVLATKEDKDKLIKAIEKAKPSSVMLSSSSIFSGTSKWSGSILKIDNKLFVTTAAHGYKDIGDFVLNEIEVKGPDYSFKITPPPFDGDKVAFFPHSEGSDMLIFPIPEDIRLVAI